MFTNTNRPSAVDVLRPFAVGDQFYADTTSTLAKGAIGSTGQIWTVSLAGIPGWSSTVAPPGLTANRFVSTNSTGALVTPAVISSDQTLTTTSTVTSKATGSAGISLDPNAATGDFTMRVSPANLTANRRFTLGDADLSITGGGTVALGGFTLTVPATGTVGLLAVANTWTAANVFSNTVQLDTSSNGLTISKTSGTTLAVSSATDSTSKDTGAIVTEGGIGAEKAIYTGTDIGVGQRIGLGGAGVSSLAAIYVGALAGVTSTTAIGLFVNATYPATATTSIRGAQFSIITPASTAVAEATGFYCAGIAAGSGGSITRVTGARIVPQEGSGTNTCGLLISSVNTYTGAWALRSESTAASYFAGNLEIAKTSGTTLTLGSTDDAAISCSGGATLKRATLTHGAITADIKTLDSTVTWNNSGVTFTGWKLNVTGTAYAAASRLIDLQLGGASRFQIDPNPGAGQTALFIYDADNATLERVTVGAADSGGSGYKLLRIPN